MKNLRLTVFLFAFAAFLLPGYWIGNQMRFMFLKVRTSDAIVTSCPRTEQVHFLLLNVDNLDKRSVTLQSAWWIIFAPDSSLQWIPLYPSPTGGEKNDKQLSKAFGLVKDSPQKVLRPGFTKILQERDICWDGFMVSDNTLLAAIVDDLGGIQIRDSYLYGSQVIDKLEKALAKTSTSLSFQSELMEEICWNALHSTLTRLLDKPAPGLEDHILLQFTDRIDPVNWHSWNQVIKVPKCDIQTFSTNSALP